MQTKNIDKYMSVLHRYRELRQQQVKQFDAYERIREEILNGYSFDSIRQFIQKGRKILKEATTNVIQHPQK